MITGAKRFCCWLAFAFAATLASTSCGDDEGPLPAFEQVVFEMKAKVEPGAEAHLCQFVKLPEGDEEIFVKGGVYDTSNGTHHFLLFRTAPDMPEQPLGQPVDCYEGDGVMQYERGFVTGGQLNHDAQEFPFGLALAFQPGDVLLMQTHVLNASAEASEASVRVELTREDPAAITDRVGTFRFYNPFIYLAPASQAKATMRCHIHESVTLLTAGAHMHARGVGYQAFFDPPGEVANAPFYTTDEWQHPDYYAGAIKMPAGSAVRFACDYDNPAGEAVVQGLSAVDEMCMFSAFYYPAQSIEEEICTSMDSHGSGDRSCAQTVSCIQLCPPEGAPQLSQGSAAVGECFQKCIVDSCPNVTATLFPQLTCTANRCDDECQSYGPICTACVVAQCKPELDACQALACDT